MARSLSLAAFSFLCFVSLVGGCWAENWFNNPEFQQLLDEQTESKAYSGNQVSLLIDGKETTERRKLNAATADLILIKTYEFWGDESGEDFLKQLLERAKSGAKVFIQFDVRGYYSNYADLLAIIIGKMSPIPPHLRRFAEESEGNGFLIPCNIPDSLLKTYPELSVKNDHEKYWITWEYKNQASPVKVILGSSNVGDMYQFSGMKDPQGNFRPVPAYMKEGFSGEDAYAFHGLNVEVVGTVTQDIVAEYIRAAEYHSESKNRYFKKHLKENVKSSIKALKVFQQKMQEESKLVFPENVGPAFVRFVVDPPHKGKGKQDIEKLLILMMQKAPKGTVFKMANSQFLPSKEYEQAMISAAKRGVFFQLLLNKPGGADWGISKIALAARCRYRYLLKHAPENSLEIYEWQGNAQAGEGEIHLKVFDFGLGEEAPFGVGSSNLDMQGLAWNSEGLLLIQSPEHKKELDAMLQRDYSKPTAKKLSLEELEAESEKEKLEECFLDKVFHAVI